MHSTTNGKRIEANPSDFLTAQEVAAALKFNPHKIYSLLARGEIPGQKIGGSWRIRRADLERLFDQASEK